MGKKQVFFIFPQVSTHCGVKCVVQACSIVTNTACTCCILVSCEEFQVGLQMILTDSRQMRWNLLNFCFFSHVPTAPGGPSPHYRGFTITLRHTTLGRAPLDGWSARRRDLYLTTHNTHNKQTSMPPAGFKPLIPTSDLPQTHPLHLAATGLGLPSF